MTIPVRVPNPEHVVPDRAPRARNDEATRNVAARSDMRLAILFDVWWGAQRVRFMHVFGWLS